MNVLVDTSIWSIVLRRRTIRDQDILQELTRLIQESRVQIIGPIRQEILSGIKTEKQFQQLKSYLTAFPDLRLETAEFEQAAEFYNICRRKGIQGSNTDFLICSVASSRNYEIFTNDKDFLEYKAHIPIKLCTLRK